MQPISRDNILQKASSSGIRKNETIKTSNKMTPKVPVSKPNTFSLGPRSSSSQKQGKLPMKPNEPVQN